MLGKLCNHPRVLYDACIAGKAQGLVGVDDFPPSYQAAAGAAADPRQASETRAAARAPAATASVVIAHRLADGGERVLAVDLKGKLVLLPGGHASAAHAVVFELGCYGSKSFIGRVSLRSGAGRWVRADTTTRRPLRVGAKCSTWESFMLRPAPPAAGGGRWVIETHHNKCWRAAGGGDIVADSESESDRACWFALSRSEGAATAPIGSPAALRAILTRLGRGRALEPIQSPAAAAAAASAAAAAPNAEDDVDDRDETSSSRAPAEFPGPALPSSALAEGSGKFVLLERMLHSIQQTTSDRIVLVAMHTQVPPPSRCAQHSPSRLKLANGACRR
jgi:hypothetical protein